MKPIPLRIVRTADRRAMPWKNKGGMTFEIAAFPAGAGLDDIEWRISMALVETDGPFSVFQGVDRTLAVLAGAGITLAIAGHVPVRLTPASTPYGFAADAPTEGQLVDGPITDLNVMTRRGRFTHRLIQMRLSNPVDFSFQADVTALIPRAAGLRVEGERGTARLEMDDAAIFPGAGGSAHLSCDIDADIILIELNEVR